MNQLGTVYATKRRRRNGKSLKPSPKESSGKSNPSKRHRERLNAELDTLASLLPFEASILSKLDRLSILRLSVSYLRTKSYFQASHKGSSKGDQYHHGAAHFLHDSSSSALQQYRRDLSVFDSPALDGECFLQALNGFLLILTSDGEVFFATHTIESYLGFHQSDVVHQSVYELVHSEDREELQRQLTWSSQLPADSGLNLIDALRPENSLILERSFTVRFRCLLDNTSGFLRLDIRGRVKVLHGQNRKTEEPPLALFAICTPFGPPSLLELPHKESMFKSKHRLDLALVSMDQRGKALLGHSDVELSSLGGYDLVHFDDLAYVASAHQELLKTGASGLIAYRLQTKDGQFQWLQTSSRLVYKNSKPDFIISTHRPLMEEEGRDLMGKRTMDFKVSYLDAGLTSSYFSDQEGSSLPPNTSGGSNLPPTVTSTTVPANTTIPSSPASTQQPPTQRIGRKYKNQLRDFLTNCRTKRKSGTSISGTQSGTTTPPEYLSGSVVVADATGGAWPTPSGGAVAAVASSAAVAAATAYSPSVYPAAAAAAAAAAVPYGDNSFYHMQHHHAAAAQANHLLHHHQPNLHQSFYPALDNRFGLPADNLFHHGYRGLAGAAGYYATDYSPYVHAAATATNGFLTAGYDSGMSQLYSSSPNTSPADSGVASNGAKYAASSRIGGIHHHSGGVLLNSSGGETDPSPSSEASSAVPSSLSGGSSIGSAGDISPYHHHQQRTSRSRKTTNEMMQQQHHHQQMNGVVTKGDDKIVDGRHSSNASSSSSTAAGGGGYGSNDTRQTVLMWGSATSGAAGTTNNTSGGSCHSSADGTVAPDLTNPAAYSSPADCGTDGVKKYHHHGYNTNGGSNHHHQQQQQQHHQQLQQHHNQHDNLTPSSIKSSPNNNSNGSSLDLNSACKWGRVGSHYLYGAASAVAAEAGGTEVSWPHSYPYPYHHQYHHHHQTHYASVDHAAHHQYSSSGNSVAAPTAVQHIPAAVNHHHSNTNSSYNSARTGVLCCPSPR